MQSDDSQSTARDGSAPSGHRQRAASGIARKHFAVALWISGVLAILGMAIAVWHAFYRNSVIAEDPSGVRIVLLRHAANIPEKWTQPPGNFKFVYVSREEAEARLAVVRAGLAKYPDGFVNRFASQICMIQGFTYSGSYASGTRYRDTVYLGTREINGTPMTDEGLDRLLHGELSGLILKEHMKQFPMITWFLQNSLDFSYPLSVAEGIQRGLGSTQAEPSLFSSGFYCKYQQVSFVVDVGFVASQVMCPTMEFQAAVVSSPRLRRKVTLWLQFLRKHGGLRPEYEQMWSAYAPLPPAQPDGG